MGRRKVGQFAHRLWREWRLAIFFIVFVVIPARSSLADWNWVPTGSMNPTIVEGDLVFVDKAAYDLRVPLTLHRFARLAEPQRGDIVVCLSPEDGTRLVKRIVGLPGETVEMKNNVLFIDGRRVQYSTADPQWVEGVPEKLRDACTLASEQLDEMSHPVMGVPAIRARRSFGPVTVQRDCYFVMGDNRDISKDSRFFGPVPRRSILGQAKGIILSVDVTDWYQPRLGRFLAPLR